MEFQKVSADPRKAVWENEDHLKVVILPTKKGEKILASGRLMKPEIDAVVDANAKGLTRCQIKTTVYFR